MAVLGCLLLAGCRDDLRPIAAGWDQLTSQWEERMAALRKDEVVRAEQLSALAARPGLDADNPSAKRAAELGEDLKAHRAALTEIGAAFTRHRTLIDQAFKKAKLAPAAAAVAEAQAELNTLLGRVTDAAQLQRQQLAALEVSATAEREASMIAAVRALEEAERWEKVSLGQGSLDLTNIRFVEGTAELEAPEAGEQKELARLVQWANNCKGLTFSLIGHSSRELEPRAAMKLSEGRAQAVKKYLLDHGVAPTRISRAYGAGALRPTVDEPLPDSKIAQEMNPDELEALRNKNRRITVEAVQVCSVG